MWILAAASALADDFCDLPAEAWDARVDERFEAAGVGPHGDKTARRLPPPTVERLADAPADVLAWTAQRPGPTQVVMLSVDSVACGLGPGEPSGWSPRFGTLYRTERDDVFVNWPVAGTPFHAVRVLDAAGFADVAGPLEDLAPLEDTLQRAIERHDRHAAIAAATRRHLYGDFVLYEAFESGDLVRATTSAQLRVDVAGLGSVLAGLDPAREGGARPEDFARYQRLAHGFVDALRAESRRGVWLALTSYLVDELPDYHVVVEPGAVRPLDHARVVTVVAAAEDALAAPPTTLHDLASTPFPTPLPWLERVRLLTQAEAALDRAPADVEAALADKRYATALGEASAAIEVGRVLGRGPDPKLVQAARAARLAFIQAICPGPARTRDREAVLAEIARLPIAGDLDAEALATLRWGRGTVRLEERAAPTLGAPTFIDGTFGLPTFRDGAAPVEVTSEWLAWKVQHELAIGLREAGFPAPEVGVEPAQRPAGRPLEFVTTNPYWVHAWVFPVSARSTWAIDGKRVDDLVSGVPIQISRVTPHRGESEAFSESTARGEATKSLPGTSWSPSRSYSDAVKASLAAYVAAKTAASSAEARWAERTAVVTGPPEGATR